MAFVPTGTKWLRPSQGLGEGGGAGGGSGRVAILLLDKYLAIFLVAVTFLTHHHVVVASLHFCCPMSLFHGHVAGRNLMCQG